MQQRHRVRRVRADVGHARTPTSSRLLEIVRPYLPEQPWLLRRRRAHRPQRALPGQRDHPREAVPPDRRRAAVHLDRRHRPVTRKRASAARASPRRIVVERDAHKGMVIGDGGERPQAHRLGGAPGAGEAARRQGVPRAVGEGALAAGPTTRRICALRYGASRAALERPARGAGRRALPAFVLHRYDWSESSLILEVFTREQGRLAVAAKGAKRPYSQLRAVLLPFQRIASASVGRRAHEGARDVHSLRAAEWVGGHADAGRRRAVQRLLPQRAADEAAGARRSASARCSTPTPTTLGALAAARRRRAEGRAARVRADCCCARSACCRDLSLATSTQQAVARASATRCMPMPGSACRDRRRPRSRGATLIGAAGRARARQPRGACSRPARRRCPSSRACCAAQLHYHLGSSRPAHATGDDRGAEPGAVDVAARLCAARNPTR